LARNSKIFISTLFNTTENGDWTKLCSIKREYALCVSLQEIVDEVRSAERFLQEGCAKHVLINRDKWLSKEMGGLVERWVAKKEMGG